MNTMALVRSASGSPGPSRASCASSAQGCYCVPEVANRHYEFDDRYRFAVHAAIDESGQSRHLDWIPVFFGAAPSHSIPTGAINFILAKLWQSSLGVSAMMTPDPAG
jgi:hypothetical protein